MAGKMSIEQLLSAKQRILNADLSVLFEHPTSKGEESENSWIEHLSSFLPARYGVTKGFVFDSKGNISKQIDIIIYDALYSLFIYKAKSGEKYITAESVYAVFDSKQEVTSETVRETNEKIASVKELYRTSRGMYSSGKEMPARGLTKILGGILAKNVKVQKDTFQKYMEQNKDIDFGCIIDDFAFFG